MLRTIGAGLLRHALTDSRSLLMLLAVVFVCNQASAKLAYEYRDDGTAGIYWEREVDEEGNEISYVGPINIPERVVENGKTYVVTEIMSNGFAYLNGVTITSVYIPNTIKTIGNDAFSGCSSMKSLTIGTGVITIGDNAFFDCENLEDVVFNAVNCQYSGYCEKIGAVWCVVGMFDSCNKIRSIKIGNGVKKIPIGAFCRLEHLETVEIPESVTHIGIHAFADCTSLTSITIPHNVTYIGDGAFYYCKALSSVTFNAEACTYMGAYNTEVFESCENLTTVTIGENVTMIPNYAFHGRDVEKIKTVVIPNSVKTIGSDAFNNCGIESLTLGNSVTTIGFGAFDNNNLSSVTIPASVTTIHSRAFGNGMDDNYKIKPLSVVFNAENCNTVINKWRHREGPDTTTIYITPVFVSEVSSLTIGDKVKKIPYYLFAGCDFKDVVIPYSVKEIGDSAFLSCKKLEYVEIKNPMTRIGKHAFGGCALLKTANIPETATEIEDGTYYGCKALEEVTIPKTVKTIGRVAFFGCSSLSNVAMGDSIETVGDKAFGDCKRLESFTLGEHAKAIGAEAFAGCTAMKSLAVFAAVPPECGDEAFKGVDVSACTLSVPEASIELYKAAPQWKEFLKVSAIGNIVDDESAILYDVYNLQGIMVGRNLTEADITADMPRGVYILVSPQGCKKLKI